MKSNTLEDFMFKIQVKNKYKIETSLSDWTGNWVHYTNINKLGVNPQQFHQDMAGIYLFPEKFKTSGTIWKGKKYKFIVKVKSDAKILDLSKLSEKDLWDLLDKLHIPRTYMHEKMNVDNFWEALKNYYMLSTSKKGSGFWNKEFRRLGYEAIFDDTGSIHTAEVQMVVLDPRILNIVDVETQNIKRGQYDRIKEHLNMLAHHLKSYGNVEIQPIKKVKELYGKNKIIKGKLKLTLGNEKYIDFEIEEDEANQEIGIIVPYSNVESISKLRQQMTISTHIKYNEENKVKDFVSWIMKKALSPEVKASWLVQIKAKYKIESGISDIVYHFTSIYNAAKILKEDQFALTFVSGADDANKPKSKYYYLSTTRSKVGSFHVDSAGYFGVLFKLNGVKLRNNYVGNPVDYWGREFRKVAPSKNEMEDRIWSDNPFIKPASKYIEEIHVYFGGDHKGGRTKWIAEPEESDKRQLKQLLKDAKDIPIFVYTDKDAAKTLDKRKATPIDQLDLKTEPQEEYQRGKRDDMEIWLELYEKNNKDELSIEPFGGAKRSLRLLSSFDGINSFEADVHNSKKGTPSLHKIVDILKKNKWTMKDFYKHLQDKWAKL